jgi:hypothetical protein
MRGWLEFSGRIWERGILRMRQPTPHHQLNPLDARKIFLRLCIKNKPILQAQRIFLILDLFHSALQLPCPLFVAILMRPAHPSTRRNVPVSLLYPRPHYTA